MIKIKGGKVERPFGKDVRVAVPSGSVTWVRSAHSVSGDSLIVPDKTVAYIRNGVLDDIDVEPGNWIVTISPKVGNGGEIRETVVVPDNPAEQEFSRLIPLSRENGFIVTKGDRGDKPVITWNGTKIVVDGVPGPDLATSPSDYPDMISILDEELGKV